MGDEENKYVSELKDVYDSCDTSGTGYLDKEELTELCRKLHLQSHLPLLLQTLLGDNHFNRVNFEEFKEGFVNLLSSRITLELSDDESSYLEPAVPDEVKPQYISGAKRYGRQTRRELQSTKLEAPKYLQEQLVKANMKSQLRRSASLESMESLKSDEEPESTKEPQDELFENQGQMYTWEDDLYDGPRVTSSSYVDMTVNQVRDIWEDLGVGNSGYLDKLELATVCKNIGLQELEKEELEELFCKLDSDGDGRISFKEFQLGLFSHCPILSPVSSTPLKPQRQKFRCCQVFGDDGHRSATASSLNLFSSIDDGSGFARPEQVVYIWAQAGVENCKEILQSLDFSMEERVNLMELSVALDDGLTASKSENQQAAFASWRHELRHLEAQVEQVSMERDKARMDLEKMEKRNLQLFKEVDDHHSALEYHNEIKFKELEQEFRGKLAVMKNEVEIERELLMQQANHQRTKLEADIKSLQGEESGLREKLTLVIKENSRLHNEVAEVVQKLSESEKQVWRLQEDLDFMLKDKLGLQDPYQTQLFDQEERFAEIIKAYELQCRELRDRNDELQTEVERLCSRLHESKLNLACPTAKTCIPPGGNLLPENVNARVPGNPRREDQLLGYQHLPATCQNGVIFVEPDPYSVSIKTELLVEELKEQHKDLKTQLDTKLNYYEREIELMKINFEKERQDLEQGFKIEITELKEQKSDLEELNVKCQEVIDGLKDQLQKLVPVQELEKRLAMERSVMEQQYTKEIFKVGQRLSKEKDQLQDEMKAKHKTEVQLRIELCRVSEDNILLRNKRGRFQQEAEDVDKANQKHRKHVDELKMAKQKVVCETEELNQLNKQYKEEIFQLNSRTHQLSHELSELSSNHKACQSTIHLLNTKLVELESQKSHEATVAKQNQEASAALTKEHLQLQLAWQDEKVLLEEQLKASAKKASQTQELETELDRLTRECQMLRLMKAQLTDELEECQERLLEANTNLGLAWSRYDQELQQLRAQVDNSVPKDNLAELQTRLAEEQEMVRMLQTKLNFQAEQMRKQLAILQEEYESSHRLMEEKVEELEMNLKNVQLILQEKVAQLKEQFEKNAKSNLLLKDFYLENAQLMKTLQITEQEQKRTEARNLILEEKISVLNIIIVELTQVSQ